ncbi:hypoxanthine-guanine phosphoribosyltransferase [Spiroplasma sp. TIUS-1]|uniref:hypoxanthine phosphoribosyltransferase n=1 Tax=Spiroplasma sp. TIUS-1 TaxID=216963 RepID=UPI001398F89B|nr:hypoxanthine phosphoribosyltransferase [Spiroplasma sp. TIUS-1]QHX35596.1 hypoxanthine-guanine phosphoribosyltransferase [Spiroplasma sp. TIUS-1]
MEKNIVLHPVMKEVMFTESQLDNKCIELAKTISDSYHKKNINNIVMLGLLKGCVPFMANLMKYMSVGVTTEYMVVASYGNSDKSSTTPQILLDINQNIENKDVLIVEDIIDSGYTLEFISRHLKNRGAKSIKIVTMFDKEERRQIAVNVDWVGFKISNEFVVGYGLDYAQKFRNLPALISVDIEKFNKYDWSKEE